MFLTGRRDGQVAFTQCTEDQGCLPDLLSTGCLSGCLPGQLSRLWSIVPAVNKHLLEGSCAERLGWEMTALEDGEEGKCCFQEGETKGAGARQG